MKPKKIIIKRMVSITNSIIQNICESKKIPLKLAFVVLFFRNNLVNLLCESTVRYNESILGYFFLNVSFSGFEGI